MTTNYIQYTDERKDGTSYEFCVTGTLCEAERQTHDYPGCPAHAEDIEASLESVTDENGQTRSGLLVVERVQIEAAFNARIESDGVLCERLADLLMEDYNARHQPRDRDDE